MTRGYRELLNLAMIGRTPSFMEADQRGFFDCESKPCAFNKDGQCRYMAVYEELPMMTKEDGCISGIFEEIL